MGVEKQNTSSARRRDRDVIELSFAGQLGRADVEAVRLAARGLLAASGPARVIVVESRAVTGFDAESRAVGRAMIDELRNAGAEIVVVITSSFMVRLACTGIALATHVPFELVKDTFEAESIVQDQLERPVARRMARAS